MFLHLFFFKSFSLLLEHFFVSSFLHDFLPPTAVVSQHLSPCLRFLFVSVLYSNSKRTPYGGREKKGMIHNLNVSVTVPLWASVEEDIFSVTLTVVCFNWPAGIWMWESERLLRWRDWRGFQTQVLKVVRRCQRSNTFHKLFCQLSWLDGPRASENHLWVAEIWEGFTSSLGALRCCEHLPLLAVSGQRIRPVCRQVACETIVQCLVV